MLEDLQALGERGVQVLACGAFPGYHELMEGSADGEISNTYTIAETMMNPGKVISLWGPVLSASTTPPPSGPSSQAWPRRASLGGRRAR